MVLRHYPPVPPSSMIEFGGYRLVKPGEWEVYLASMIQVEYPAYYQEQSGNLDSSLWRSNACILESLEKYLFNQYGVYIPKDNLFKVYNQAGEGIPPGQLLEAIAAVIEPLGFEVERVIVPDPELRAALGDDRITVGMEGASFFESQPGLCMINIKSGESHAFYWERMNTKRFYKEQFRMAISIKPVALLSAQALSASESAQGFCKLLREYLGKQEPLGALQLTPLLNQVEALDHCFHDESCRQEKSFREKVFNRVSSLLILLGDLVSTLPQPASEEATLLEAGELIRRIYTDAPLLGVS